ncbi:MAG: glycosyltransferase family 39 protein [Chloroflexi bacterium]|nr:glycosyltransferase family 39 protein [Chloroflexota bacterium]
MNEIVGIGGYLAAGGAVALLIAALYLRERPRRTSGPASAGPSVGQMSARDRLAGPVSAGALPSAILLLGSVLAGGSIYLAGRLWTESTDLAALWWLLAVGAAFGLLSLAGLGWTAAPATADADSDPAESGRPGPARAAVLTVVVGLALEVACLGLFWVGRLLTVAWLLHIAACAVFLVGLWRLTRPSLRRIVPDWDLADTRWVVGLTAVGLFLRLWHIDAIPRGLWFDETQRGIEALRMIAEPGYRPIFAAGILQEPTGLWYFIMTLIPIFGRDPLTLRLPVAVGGALGIAAVYLLGRVLYGRRAGVVAAGLLVALVWHLNFSRVALPAVLSLTCDTLAAAVFVVGVRRRSGYLLALAGVVGGAGLYFYYTSQLMPFVLAVGAGQFVLATRFRELRRTIAVMALFALGFLLAAGPFGFYAVTNWGQFSARAGTVSVFNEVASAGSYAPLIDNVRAHLMMFHVRGDPNGRHNWSGRPMLDAVTGGLVVLGLAMSLSRFWRLEQAIVLSWIPAALAGGIFSITWEAPQSHRAIGAIVPAVLLASLPLALLWERLDDVSRRLPSGRGGFTVARLGPVLTASLVVLILGATDYANADRFFGRQMRDTRTWLEFASPQTEAGRQAAQLPPDMKVYLEPSWLGHPSVRWTDPSRREFAAFETATQLPIVDAQAAIFIGDRPAVAERIAALYPGALRSYTRTPDGGTVGYGFVLPQAIVQETRGVAARYQGPAGSAERRESGLVHEWPRGVPIPPPFEASWSTTLTVQTYNTYRFRLEAPSAAVLTLDGIELVKGGNEVAVKLARGNHALRLAGSALGQEPVRLLWAPGTEAFRPIPGNLLNAAPVRTTGLLARIYRGEDMKAEPIQEQVDPTVDLTVHTLPTARPYTMEWSGALRIEREGRYRLGVNSLGTSAIWVDGEQVAVNTANGGSADGEVQLSVGWHDVRIRFLDTLGFSFVNAFWQPPGGARAVIPTTALRPWPAYRTVAARPEDADLPAPTTAPADGVSVAVAPIAPPETVQDKVDLGEGQVVSPAGALGQPRGIAVGPDGTLYVADGVKKAIVRIGRDGSTALLGEGALKEPSAVAVYQSGLAVADAGAGSVVEMSYQGAVGARLFAEYPMYSPRGLLTTAAGDLVVADTGNDRLLIRAVDGAIRVVPGLSQPTSGALLPDGTILAAEGGANRIVHQEPDGVRLMTWAMPPSLTVNGPHIGVLPDGGWLATLPEERAIMARPAGGGPAVLWTLGGMKKSTGIATGAEGVYVVDVDSQNVRRYALPGR